MARLPDMDDLSEEFRKTERTSKIPRSRKAPKWFDLFFFFIILSVPTVIGVSALLFGNIALGLFLLSPWIVVYWLTKD